MNNLTGKASIDKPWEKYYSEEVRNFEFPKKTLYECIYDNNINHLNRIALEYYGRKITYKELFDGIEKATKSLRVADVKKGDIVTIAMPTTPETVCLFYALSKIGAIGNMVDPRTSAAGIINYTKEAKSKLFISIDLCYDKIKNITEETDVEKIVTISAADSLPLGMNFGYKIGEIFNCFTGKSIKIPKKDNLMNWNQFIETGKDYKIKIKSNYEKDMPVAILHTGGTTGTSKGVLLSNDNFNAIAYQYKLSGMHLLPGHRFLDIMPPFIAYGIGCGIHMPLVIGMTSIIIPKFDPKNFDKLIRDLKPNHMAGVPSHWGNVINSKKLRNRDLSYLITPAVGGDAMNVKLEQQANEFLQSHGAPNNIIKGYGMTEECSLATACINDINAVGSVGIPLPQNLVSIFNPETNEEMGYNEIGEICLSGPTTMISYFENEIETNSILKKHNDGRIWVHTHDIGYMTEDGLLYVDGRIKRMIIRHDGFKVFPFTIEKLISSHNAVESCMVVATPDKERCQGCVPKAHIILKPEYESIVDAVEFDLRKLCAENLPEYAIPESYKFRNEFPYTPIGKIDFIALENESDNNDKLLIEKTYKKR